MADTKKTVHLIIERQDSPTGKPYTEEFEIQDIPIVCKMIPYISMT